jgi:hypothetical protein
MSVATTEYGQRIVSRPSDLSRAYRHVDCGRETIVSGDDYVLLECPFRPVTSTYCACCGDFVPLDAVEWTDTGESIAAYRQRIAAGVPFLRQVYLYVFGNAYEGAVALNLDSRGRRR